MPTVMKDASLTGSRASHISSLGFIVSGISLEAVRYCWEMSWLMITTKSFGGAGMDFSQLHLVLSIFELQATCYTSPQYLSWPLTEYSTVFLLKLCTARLLGLFRLKIRHILFWIFFASFTWYFAWTFLLELMLSHFQSVLCISHHKCIHVGANCPQRLPSVSVQMSRDRNGIRKREKWSSRGQGQEKESGMKRG